MIFTKTIEKIFDIANYELRRPLAKKKKTIGLIKDELGGKIVKKSFSLRVKTYTYLMGDGSEEKKGKDTIKSVIKKPSI